MVVGDGMRRRSGGGEGSLITKSIANTNERVNPDDIERPVREGRDGFRRISHTR